MNDPLNRRTFLRAALAAGAGWAVADIAQVEDALAWSMQHAGSTDVSQLRALTAAQARTVDAVVSRILPAVNGRPGAREAGAVYFVDKALSTFAAGQKAMYVQGLADLDRRAASKAGAGHTFDAISPAQQDEILHDIEQSPFFQAIRFSTLVGTFALPSWGGNREYTGWHLIGFDHQPRFQPPFGDYDAEINRRS